MRDPTSFGAIDVAPKFIKSIDSDDLNDNRYYELKSKIEELGRKH